jgi:uncharacterized membrane protein SpoIIM required for sporulation
MSYEPEMVEEFLTRLKGEDVFLNYFNLLKEGKFLQIFYLIYSHNLGVSLTNFILGITFIFPVILEVFNGIFIGFLFGISPSSLPTLIDGVGTALILLLEIIAGILASVEGIYLSYSFLKPKKVWKTKSRRQALSKTFRQNVKVIIVVVLLLLLAAIIETLLIYNQWLRNLEPIMIGV